MKTLQSADTHNGVRTGVRKESVFEGMRNTSWSSAPEPVQHVFVWNRHRLKRCLSVTLEKIMLSTGVPAVGNIITLLRRARTARATARGMLWCEYISRHFLHYPCVLSCVRHLYHAGASFSSPPWAAQPQWRRSGFK